MLIILNWTFISFSSLCFNTAALTQFRCRGFWNRDGESAWLFCSSIFMWKLQKTWSKVLFKKRPHIKFPKISSDDPCYQKLQVVLYLIEYVDDVEENPKAINRSDLSETCGFPKSLCLGKGLWVLIWWIKRRPLVIFSWWCSMAVSQSRKTSRSNCWKTHSCVHGLNSHKRNQLISFHFSLQSWSEV